MWALYPEGMLQSNKLINDPQIEQIDDWIVNLSYTAFCLLDGTGTKEAFWDYDNKK